MCNVFLRISYDGTDYSGFQIQNNAPTIQEALEKALALIYKQPVRIAGAGRTDAGVHAGAQAANFKAPFTIPIGRLPFALNALLPDDIVITGAIEVPPQFHARFNARGKCYSYTIDRAPFPQVFRRRYSWHQPDEIDLTMIKTAAEHLEGTHDFKPFQAAGSKARKTVRTVSKIEIVEDREQQILRLIFWGSGFLYRMVRLMTGTLLRVGRGRLTPAEVGEVLTGLRPAAVGPTAPAKGLCLEEISYDFICTKY